MLDETEEPADREEDDEADGYFVGFACFREMAPYCYHLYGLVIDLLACLCYCFYSDK